MTLHLDTTVAVIKEDGTRVLTNVIEPDDELLGGATYEEIAKRYEESPSAGPGAIRSDADLSDEEKKPSVVVTPEEDTTPSTDVTTPEQVAEAVAPKKHHKDA